MTLEVESSVTYNSDPFWGKWGEDSGICLLRIIRFAPEHRDFPQNHFWELIFGILFLGVPVKWGFLFPKNKEADLLLLGKGCCFLGIFPKVAQSFWE